MKWENRGFPCAEESAQLQKAKDKEGSLMVGQLPSSHANQSIFSNSPAHAQSFIQDIFKKASDSSRISTEFTKETQKCPSGKRLNIDNLIFILSKRSPVSYQFSMVRLKTEQSMDFAANALGISSVQYTKINPVQSLGQTPMVEMPALLLFIKNALFHLLNMHLSVFTISHLALIHLVLVNWSLWESKLRHM